MLYDEVKGAKTAAVDPYIYPGTFTLKNNFDLRNRDEVITVEQTFFHLRYLEGMPAGSLDSAHLCAIHQHLFSDMYSWAGHYRVIPLKRGHTVFTHPNKIHEQLQRLSSELAAENYLQDCGLERQITRLVYYHNQLQLIQPFRHGNGRAIRAWLDEISCLAGIKIDWSKVNRAEYLQATKDGLVGRNHAMHHIFSQCVGPDSLASVPSIEEQFAYEVQATREIEHFKHCIRNGMIPSFSLMDAEDRISQPSLRRVDFDQFTQSIRDQSAGATSGPSPG